MAALLAIAVDTAKRSWSRRRRSAASEVGRRLGVEARDDAAPLPGNERYRRLADAQMIVGRFQPALGLHRQIEIAIPVALGLDRSGRGADDQREEFPHP